MLCGGTCHPSVTTKVEVLNSAGGWVLKKEFIKKEAMKLFWKIFISGEGDVQQHYRLRQLRVTPWCEI